MTWIRERLERTFAAVARALGSEQARLGNNFHTQGTRWEQENEHLSCSDLPMPGQQMLPCLQVPGYQREFAHVAAALATLLQLVPKQNKLRALVLAGGGLKGPAAAGYIIRGKIEPVERKCRTNPVALGACFDGSY